MGIIKILNKTAAMKIAAGEVIDRPASVLRELLDNSIDAGSSQISVYLDASGMKEVRVTDNGAGMDEDDLKLCILPHATSKIETAEDLYKIKTLGFRGEALSSIAFSSKLEIISSTEKGAAKGGGGFRLTCSSKGEASIERYKSSKGTTISAKELFYAFPARKKFLKSPAAETTLCKNIFFEKAAARPDIGFKLYIDSAMTAALPASGSKERIQLCYSHVFKDAALLYETIPDAFSGQEASLFSITGLFADPVLFRKDRKYIHIYLNGRRIQEYSLVQAVCYGYSKFLPGGHYPAAVIFIENSPELVDFNIHPAKKEAKIKNISTIHHAITEIISNILSEQVLSKPSNYIEKSINNWIAAEIPFPKREKTVYPLPSFPTYVKENGEINYKVEASSSSVKEETNTYANFRYLGQLFTTFLLCEKEDSLYLIDQHAAHEKYIFQSFTKKKPVIQKLLIPLYLSPDTELNTASIEEYKKCGIIIEKDDTGKLFLDSLPDILNSIKDKVTAVIDKAPGNVNEVQKKLFATASCKKAVKAGDILYQEEAIEVIKAAFDLEIPYCPHGRPVWKRITKSELWEEINRTI